jgi:hypothetical protein
MPYKAAPPLAIQAVQHVMDYMLLMLSLLDAAPHTTDAQHPAWYFLLLAVPCLTCRSALSALHPQLPVLMVVMATRQRSIAFPHIDIVAAQQMVLQLPGLFKLEMTGFEFYPMDVGVPGGEAQLVHLTKAGCAALGVAMGYLVASKG